MKREARVDEAEVLLRTLFQPRLTVSRPNPHLIVQQRDRHDGMGFASIARDHFASAPAQRHGGRGVADFRSEGEISSRESDRGPKTVSERFRALRKSADG